MKFPLYGKKKIVTNETISFSKDYTELAEIPLGVHPGAFSVIRKNHIHEGVDLYCNNGDCVVSMDKGIILSITQFTGEKVGSSWWNDTYSIMVKHKDFTINYGEVTPLENLKVGEKVKQGQLIGHVKQVLKKDKGRPMSMLHLEMYHNYVGDDEIFEPISGWQLGTKKPAALMNPTSYLIPFVTEKL